jgi:long-chain acyl-CoA synthetase
MRNGSGEPRAVSPPGEPSPWTRFYPPGLSALYVPEHDTMLDVWEAAVATAGDSPCIHSFDDSLSYREVDRASDAFARALLAGGFEAADRLAVLLQNDPQWLVALLGTWKAGGIVVPVNPMLKERELVAQLADSGASALVSLDDLYRALPSSALARTAVRLVVVTRPTDRVGSRADTFEAPPGTADFLALLDEHREGRLPRHPANPAEVAVLTYTSGTTGPAKAAMNTHRNIAYNAQLARDWFDLGSDDVVLGVAPLFHITGLVLHIAVSWAARAPLVIFHRFDAGTCLRLAERWGATFSVASITAYIALLQHPDVGRRDLSRLTKVASGGAPVSPAIVERFERTTGSSIHNVYGLTETTSPSHLTPLGARGPIDSRTGALSVGLPVPGARVQVVDLETGEELPADRIGEIVIEGPMVVPGYWENEEATTDTIPGGRLHTGDVGYMDSDGWFFVIDRVKDQINASGFKVWPREVEEVLYEHPSVREAAVVGVPDSYRGETVKAFVSLRAGAVATADELIAHCRERLAAYKYPREIEFLNEIPKTPTGKVLRRELRRARSNGEATRRTAQSPSPTG